MRTVKGFRSSPMPKLVENDHGRGATIPSWKTCSNECVDSIPRSLMPAYPIIGRMAIFYHISECDHDKGRFTRNVDAAVQRTDLKRIVASAEKSGSSTDMWRESTGSSTRFSRAPVRPSILFSRAKGSGQPILSRPLFRSRSHH
jgi:hypothetical protein